MCCFNVLGRYMYSFVSEIQTCNFFSLFLKETQNYNGFELISNTDCLDIGNKS